MPDVALLDIAGARPAKPGKYTEIYTAKFVGGLQTQRSPFASLDNRYNSRYLGGRADALIAGSNVELNNKLLWQRRPGLLQYGTSSIPAPSFFFSWQQSQTANFIAAVDPLNVGIPYASENLQLIVDTLTDGSTTPGNVYNYSPTNAGIIFNKAPLSRQTSLITVVSTMYAGDGVDLYKVTGANLLTQSNTFGNAVWANSSTSFVTGHIDPTGGTAATQFSFVGTASGISQAVFPNYTPVGSNTFTFSVWLKSLSGNTSIQLFMEDQSNNIIANQSFTITNSWNLYQITGTALLSATGVKVGISTLVNTAGTFDVYGAQLEVGGPATPTIITTTKPLGVYLWGIQAPSTAPTFTTTAQSGTTGLPWQPDHNYSTTSFVLSGVAATVNNGAVYTGTISGGGANAFAGFYFSVSGFTNASNNSVAPGFICTASTATTLTLNNLSAVLESHAATAIKLDTVIDSNGNLEVAYIPGKSGTTQPVWNMVQGGATQDGLQNIVVQNTSSLSSNATVSATFPSAVAATDTKLMFIATRAPGSIAVNDSSGNTPILLTSQTTRDFKIYAYYVLSATGGATTISVTGGGSSGTWLGIAEIVNQTATDGSASNGSFNSSNSLFLSGSVTTTNPIDVLVTYALFSNSVNLSQEQGNLPSGYQGMVSQAATTVGPNGGSSAAFWNMTVGYEVLLATASVNPQWTISNVSTGSTILMGLTGAFKSSVGSLVWYNIGQTATTGLSPKLGYTYYYSFVNTYTGHRSNVSPLSASTGIQTGVAINVSGMGMQTTPSGPANQDPQVDAIEVYRNTDGGGFWYQIPPSLMTNPSGLIIGADGKTYLANPGTATSPGMWSFSDKVLDSQLNTQIFAPVGFLNSTPPAGLTNLEFWDGRLWGSVGGTLYYATGADDATLINVVENGVSAESWEPTNFIPFNSPIVRSVATGGGLIVFTTTDVWGISGTNLATYNPIKLLTGVGLGTYNGLCIDGSTMMIQTRDRQCIMLNVSSGVQEIGFVIGDIIENDINPITCYLARHVKGSQDNAFYLGDGATGWFRLNPNMFGASASGEQTPIWSPFATITNGAGAIASIETVPGVKQLLVGSPNNSNSTTPLATVIDFGPQGNVSTMNLTVTAGTQGINVGDMGIFVIYSHSAGSFFTPRTNSITDSLGNSYAVTGTPGNNRSKDITLTGSGQQPTASLCTAKMTSAVAPNGTFTATITMNGSLTIMDVIFVSVTGITLVGGGANEMSYLNSAASGNTPATTFQTHVPSPTSNLFYISFAVPNGTLVSYPSGYTPIVPLGGNINGAWFNNINGSSANDLWTQSSSTWGVFQCGFQINNPNFTSINPILYRDINTFADNGTPYTWSETFGSFVLAQPGKLAEMESITTEMTAQSANQCTVGVIIDEISGPFEDITTVGTNPVPDPPGYDASTSVLSNRFYLSPGTIPPIGRHLQIQLNGAATATKDELLSLTVRGCLLEEQSV